MPFSGILTEDRIQVTVKQFTGIGEVLFGIGYGRFSPREGLIENGDDAFLFEKRRYRHRKVSYVFFAESSLR